MDYNEEKSSEKSKVVRLVDYLMRIALLRTKIIRDVSEYQNVLWVKDIPMQKGCFTQGWGRNENFDTDVWIEVQTSREPELPSVPALCEDWIEKRSLRNKSDIPDLRSEITKQDKNPAWHEESYQPEYISRTERLEDHREIQSTWDKYLEENWLPWVEAHNDWDSVHKVYSKLFTIHQEQLRLGEEYELVLALGLLTWQTPSSQRIHRHFIVANAILEFEARLGKFTVRPLPDGASVRPELDMLDIEEQPVRAEETANAALANAGDDPWERDCIEGVLQALVHSINAQGEYDNALEAKGVRASDKPIVEYAPALILRKRSTKGLNEALKRIRVRIENGEEVPVEFRDLSEIRSENEVNLGNGPSETNSGFDGEVFFPKLSNDEQRRIVEKLRSASGVLVQGPPGTGKSHTIANLICHLLATGQRILITAKTPRALQVLERLIPEELRPLCINLLGSGLEEKTSLESSVGGILRKSEEWKEESAGRERETLGQRLHELREEKAKVDRRLRSIRESETHSHTIANLKYQGTAARIAEAVNRDRTTYDWFTDTVPFEQDCPIHKKDLHSVLKALRGFPIEKRQEMNLTWPDNLPSPEEISNLFEREHNAIEEETRSTNGADEQIADYLSRVDATTIIEIRNSFSDFQNKCRQLLAMPYSWVDDALRDVTGGNLPVWRELHRVTRDAIDVIEPLVQVADETSIDYSIEINIRTLLEDVCKLIDYMKNDGKLSWGPFRPKMVRELVYILKEVKLNGRTCSSLEKLSTLAGVLRVRVELEKTWGFWVSRCEITQGPYALQMQALRALSDNLSDVLSLENLIERCNKSLQQCPSLGVPIWADQSQVQTIIASCRLALARNAKHLAAEEIRSIDATLLSFIGGTMTHPITNESLQAIRNRDVDEFTRCCRRVKELETEHHSLQLLNENVNKLHHILPILMQELEHSCDDPGWDRCVPQIQDAWCWAQARFWVGEYIRQEDAPSLGKRARQIEDEINSTCAKLASLHAWSFCFSRLKEPHRRHMEAWQQSMQRLGKGTGKYAPRHRREAQHHLNECREAVPAWVMPLYRVWDTVDPAPGMFDVVIIDEASQCGVEALPLFYLGKKILVVGDDKQISPDAVGLPRDAVHRLMEEFLYDFHFKSSFDVESSLFDHGKLRYSKRTITLREHFRCMPEIIRFSNDLCYSDTPLIPLRQYGLDRLTPLEHIFVSGGYREGTNNRVVNRPEAEAIVEKIAELCADKRYSGKTMGVIVLQGESQAGLIEGQLLERLGAAEMERRRLVCGNAYSFQGDERDIIFLSMIAATNERIGPFTKTADERRFNVAASRARDQMFLFHSVRAEDLSTSCLRRRLIEFFENKNPQEIAGIDREELERRAYQDNRSIVEPPAPFESWFEIDVALELVRKGFNVLPQYEVAGKRIDLVVEGGNARLAVECDGDKWHGPARYEEDMQRQRQLERCDWEFFRIRESGFYSNKEGAIQRLWRVLEEKGIVPGALLADEVDELDENENDYDDVEADGDESDFVSPPADSFGGEGRHSIKRAEEVTTLEIQNAIIRVLSECPNQSCTIKSITSRVLKELGIVTRGNPRMKFEQHVMRGLGVLERRKQIEKYKAKNQRMKLLQMSLFQKER